MIAKKYKLPIKEFLKKRSKIFFKSEFFGVRANPNDLQYSRFGVVISKKVFAKATGRNKIKRFIFNFIRFKKLHLLPAKDVLITAMPAVAQLDKKELETDLEKILKKF